MMIPRPIATMRETPSCARNMGGVYHSDLEQKTQARFMLETRQCVGKKWVD